MSDLGFDLAAIQAARGGHSIFSPSSSAMWMGCSGSLIPNLFCEDSAGEDAAYGTVAHMVTETWLRTGKKPKHLVGEKEWVESGDWGFLIDIDETMLDYAQMCVDWVQLLPGQHFIERRVDFSRVTPIPGQTGTADFIACSLGRMVIADWKFGKGVLVEAEGNTQAQLYALGAFYEFDEQYHFEEIEIRIAQPRLGHFDTWVITREQLLQFEQVARERAHAAWRKDAPRTPSEKACQWCKVKATCTAVAKLNADLMAAAFDLVGAEVDQETMAGFKEDLIFTAIPETVDPGTLSTGDLATLYGFRGLMESWWRGVELELYQRAIRGEQVPGHKLVESRSRRQFRDPEAATGKLLTLGLTEEEVWKRAMASPSQVETALVKKGYRRKDVPGLIEDLVFKPVGKPTLAPLRDKRPAIQDLTGFAFEDLVGNAENPEDDL